LFRLERYFLLSEAWMKKQHK